MSGAAPRRAVAVVVSRFPRVTETFILREIDELERQGQPVRLVPLIREHPPVVHPEARPWVARALYTPWLSPAILGSNLRALARRTGRYLGLLARVVAGTLRHPGVLVRSLVLWPKSVHLGERLAAEEVAHVHAHFATYPATTAWIAHRLFDLPFSFTVHAHDVFVQRALLGRKIAAASFVRSISEFNRRYLAQRFPAAREPGKVAVVHMGIEPGTYQGAAGEPAADEADKAGGAGDSDPPRQLLCVAALKPYKGIPMLLAACRMLADEGRGFVCDIVGDGPLRGRLEAEIRRRGLEDGAGPVQVRLLGARTQGEVARRMARADLFVLPSVVAPDGQMEGIPVVLMEALASGTPVVTTRLSGIPELVEDGVTGLLVEPGDPQALAWALGRLLDDLDGLDDPGDPGDEAAAGSGGGGGGGLASRLAAAGRRRVAEAFAVEGTVAALADLWEGDVAPEEAAAEDGFDFAAALPKDLRPAGGRVGLRSVHRSPDARVARLLVPSPEGSREVVVKKPRDRPGQSRPPAERARWEHRILGRLHAAGLAVPRPLGLAPAGDALVMEAVDGERLDGMLRRLRWARPSRFARLEPAFRAAGRWLRRLRQVVGGRHGDFWPGNVWVRQEGGEYRVTVLDLEGYAEEGVENDGGAETDRAGEGPQVDDAEHFLAIARQYLAYPFLGRRWRRLERAFREGLA